MCKSAVNDALTLVLIIIFIINIKLSSTDLSPNTHQNYSTYSGGDVPDKIK